MATLFSPAPPPQPAPTRTGSSGGPHPVSAPPAAAAPGNVRTGARIIEPQTTPDLRCWVKFVRGTPYQGEYGFDWIEWQRDPDPRHLTDEMTEVASVPIANFEYCYDEHTQQYAAVATDAHLKRKLQSEYPRLLIYGEDYYSAWLSIRPNQEIKLELHVELLNSDPVNEDYLTFGPHESYQVTVNGQVNEAIRLVPTGPAGGSPTLAAPGGSPTPAAPGAGAVVTTPSSSAAAQVVVATIKCLKACRDTTLRVLDEKGTLVGQLNVVSNLKAYHLPIRIVYLVKDGLASATNLAALKTLYAGLNLKKYLDENSLNQAQIETVFENTSATYELIFSEASWAGKFYDVTNNWYTDNAGPPKMVFLDKVMADYKAKYETHGKPVFRGIVLVVTDISKNPADHEGGVSRVIPLDSNRIIIYNSNLNDKSSYAHEIGHTLGLEHTFLDGQAYLNSIKADIISNQGVLATQLSNRPIYASRITYFQNQVAAAPAGSPARATAQASLTAERAAAAKNEQDIRKTQALIAETKKGVQSYAANTFRFKRGTTQNIMDYTSPTTRINFYHWQWKIMQADVLHYYGN